MTPPPPTTAAARSLLLLVSLLLLSQTYFALTHAATVGEWSRVSVRRGSPPLEGSNHACALVKDVGKERIFVFGGRTGLTTYSNTLHFFDIESQTWVKPGIEVQGTRKELPGLAGHTMTKLKDSLYIFGGRSGLFDVTQELYEFNTKSDTARLVDIPEGTPKPPVRLSHSAVAVNGDRDLLVFGGYDNNRRLNDVWLFNTETGVWTEVVTEDAPSPMEGHSAVVRKNKMYVFGGFNGNDFITDINVLDLDTFKWSKLKVQGKPRAFHSATLVGDWIYIIGGTITQGPVNDVIIFDTASNRWIGYPLSGEISPRQGHCAVGHSNGIYVYGGSRDWKTRYNDMMLLDTDPEATKQRMQQASASAPKKELSEEIDIAIANLNLLAGDGGAAGKKDVDTAIEQDVMSLVQQDKEEHFSDVVKNVELWNQIDILYKNFINARNKTTSVKISEQLESITRINNEYRELKDKLQEQSIKLREKLDELKQKEEKTREWSRKILEIGISQEANVNATRRLEKEQSEIAVSITLLKRTLLELGNEIRFNEGRKEMLEKKLTDDGSNERNKEKELINAKEVLQDEIAKVNGDISTLNTRIRKMTVSISNTERQLTRLDDLRREVEELKSKLERTVESQKIYETSKDALLKRLEESDIQTSVSPMSRNVQTDSDAKWLEKLLSDNLSTLQQSLSERRIELESSSKELQAKRIVLDDLHNRLSQVQKDLERVQQSLNMFESMKSKNTEERDTVAESLETLKANLQSRTEELSRSEKRMEEVKAELDAVRKEKQRIFAEIKDAKENENIANRELTSAKAALQSDYQELKQGLNQAKQQSESLFTLRRELTATRNDFQSQRSNLDKLRQALIEKLKEAQGPCAQLVATEFSVGNE